MSKHDVMSDRGMPLYGRLHRLWFLWAERTDWLAPWRLVCWVCRGHSAAWNYGRTYCTVYGKTLSVDRWRQQKNT